MSEIQSGPILVFVRLLLLNVYLFLVE